MKFFNPKEEVIDLELTPYGESLLSVGIFKPVYYAFFDDDVVYNTHLQTTASVTGGTFHIFKICLILGNNISKIT